MFSRKGYPWQRIANHTSIGPAWFQDNDPFMGNLEWRQRILEIGAIPLCHWIARFVAKKTNEEVSLKHDCFNRKDHRLGTVISNRSRKGDIHRSSCQDLCNSTGRRG